MSPGRRGPSALALALCLVAGGCGRLGGEVLQSSQNGALPLSAGEVLGQTFEPAGDELVGIGLTTATYGRTPSGVLVTDLLDAADGRLLATAEVDGRDVADNGWTAFRFDSSVPAPGRVALEVRWDGTEPIGLYANVPPAEGADRGGLQVTAPGAAVAAPLENDPYPGGELLRDGRPAAGDLAFRVVGGGGPAAAVRTVAGTVGGGLSGLASAPVFTVLWVLALAGCAVLTLRGLRGGADPAREHRRSPAGPDQRATGPRRRSSHR